MPPPPPPMNVQNGPSAPSAPANVGPLPPQPSQYQETPAYATNSALVALEGESCGYSSLTQRVAGCAEGL